MRRIDPASIPENIRLFRVNVLEAILSQKVGLPSIDYSANGYLSRLHSLRKRRRELDCLCAQITNSEWGSILTTYRVQTQTIINDPFALIETPYSQSLLSIVDILYDTLFDQNYWTGMGEQPFSKMIFKKHFFGIHSWWVCPYCDMSKDLENVSFEVDHLLPKSRFPLLGINEWNLFPICQACNSMHTGKGDGIISQYRNLFAQQIGDMVNFTFDAPCCGAESANPDVSDHLELIKLNQRFRNPGVSREIEKIKYKVYKDLKANINNRGLLDYNDSFYFISRDIYRDAENDLSR